MKKINLKSIIRIVVFSLIGLYAISIFINQQKTLNSYKSTQDYYAMQIEQKKKEKDQLTITKNNINSQEYIEEIAREKLDMYLPNERVYIDVGQ